VGVNTVLSPQQITGATLVKARLLAFSQSFNTTDALDAGIDGFIEIRDTSTGAA
jgi:hypothetical protein